MNTLSLIVKSDNQLSMARPDLKEQRTQQILDAFDRCAAVHGFAGATLQRVAQEAGLARALIRHNVGNREELEAAAIDRFFERSQEQWDALFTGLPSHLKTQAVCDRLFARGESDHQLVLLTQAIMVRAADDPALSARLSGWLDDILASLRAVVLQDKPDLGSAKADGIAGGLLSTYFNLVSFQILGELPSLESASMRGVEILLATLDT